MPRNSILCIVGPTAVGKTALSIEAAKRMQAEIVSADSVQVYRGMDIGSAKPTKAERQGIPHHLIDCVDVDTPSFSVSAYFRLASEAISEISGRGRIPLVVGGSGLYVHALTYPMSFGVPSDMSVRKSLDDAYLASPETLYKRLADVDPASAAHIHLNDRKRVVRALEVFECSGKPLSAYGSDFDNAAGEAPPFSAILAGLTMERERLYRRIDLRVDQMLRDGLWDEARGIWNRGYPETLPAMQSIGYRQMFACFRGEMTMAETVELIKRETRRYAKRQMTWFKRDPRIRWFPVPEHADELPAFSDQFCGWLAAQWEERHES